MIFGKPTQASDLGNYTFVVWFYDKYTPLSTRGQTSFNLDIYNNPPSIINPVSN